MTIDQIVALAAEGPSDALWDALIAARTFKRVDKHTALIIALRAWPEKLRDELATHLNCAKTTVWNVYHSLYPDSPPPLRGRPLHEARLREQVIALIRDGLTSNAIIEQLPIGRSTVNRIRRRLEGRTPPLRRSAGDRITTIREMAEAGYSSRQIASACDISLPYCRALTKKAGIDVTADRTIGKMHHHNSNRIIAQIVMDAAHLTEGTQLIDYRQLDPAQLHEWIDSLHRSREQLSGFIRRLKEHHHGQVA